jgi:hypothetical protein
LKENKLKNIILTTTAIVTFAATSAFANEITFNQRDNVGVSNLVFEQANIGGSNKINLGISGGMTSVIIKQNRGEVGNTSSGNTADVELYVNSDPTTQFDGSEDAVRGGGWKTFSSTFDGDNNKLVFDLGNTSDVTQFSNVDVDIAVTGDGNDLNHYVANGSDGDSLQIGGIVNGDSNYVVATLGSVGDIAFNYDIQGSNNEYTSTVGKASGGRTVKLALTGDYNVWAVTANAGGGVLNVASKGDNITGTLTQAGQGSDLQMDINKLGPTALYVTTKQTGPSSANVTVNADDGGAFTLIQRGKASYSGAINLSAGGAVTITQ